MANRDDVDRSLKKQKIVIIEITIKYLITIFREEATSTLTSFHGGPIFWLNWNLEMLVFRGGRKTGEPGEQPSDQGEKQQQTQSTHDTGPESNPGVNSGRQALSLLRHPCSPKICMIKGNRVYPTI